MPVAGSFAWERKWEPVLLTNAATRFAMLGTALADLRLWKRRQVGGVVVTILTSEGSLVRTQLCPLPGQSVAGRLRG